MVTFQLQLYNCYCWVSRHCCCYWLLSWCCCCRLCSDLIVVDDDVPASDVVVAVDSRLIVNVAEIIDSDNVIFIVDF